MSPPLAHSRPASPLSLTWSAVAFVPVVIASGLAVTWSNRAMHAAQAKEGGVMLSLGPNAGLYEWQVETLPGHMAVAGLVVSVLLLVVAILCRKLPPVALCLAVGFGFIWFAAMMALGFNSFEAFP